MRIFFENGAVYTSMEQNGIIDKFGLCLGMHHDTKSENFLNTLQKDDYIAIKASDLIKLKDKNEEKNWEDDW